MQNRKDWIPAYSRGNDGRRVKRVRPLLGTYVEIELHGPGGERALHDLISRGFKAIEDVERRMSIYRPDSDVSRLNRARSGTWVTLHRDTMQVLRASEKLFQASQGLFNPGVPLELNGRRARKTGSASLDLGGIAKGYAVDAAVDAMFKRPGTKTLSGVVNAGGDLRVFGAAAPISIHIPGRSGQRLHSFRVGPTAVATSSVRTGTRPGRPLTGCSHVNRLSGRILQDPATVTVFADRCMVADALTKVLLLAPARLAESCLRTYNAHAMIFKADGLLDRAA